LNYECTCILITVPTLCLNIVIAAEQQSDLLLFVSLKFILPSVVRKFKLGLLVVVVSS
jgi:hypothetical protein